MPGSVAEEPRTRGHKKRARTRQRLLAAAIEVIADQGDSFSITHVVERAEVANGTFYNYFDDRDALIAAVVPEMISAFARNSDRAVVEVDPVLRFATITAIALRRVETAPVETRALLRLDAMRGAMRADGALGHLRNDLAAGVADGRFAVDDSDAAVDVVVGSMVMAMHRALDRGRDPAHERSVLTHLLRALGVSGSDARDLAARAVEVASASPD